MIYIASDHAGFRLKEELKKFLIKEKIKINDLGAYKYDKNDDYPDYALKLGQKVSKDKKSKGILICGSGLGMSIAANKIPGVYAALIHNKKSANEAKQDLNANVITIGAWDINKKILKNIIKVWSKKRFGGGRHSRRIDKIKKIERKFLK